MGESKLKVATKAINLMQYTMQITSNRKRYPAKHLILVQRIQNTCMDIYEFILDSNRQNLNLSKDVRLELQSKVITSCDKLSCYIEISMNLGIVGSKTVECWQKKINDVKYMTISWRERDRKR